MKLVLWLVVTGRMIVLAALTWVGKGSVAALPATGDRIPGRPHRPQTVHGKDGDRPMAAANHHAAAAFEDLRGLDPLDRRILAEMEWEGCPNTE